MIHILIDEYFFIKKLSQEKKQTVKHLKPAAVRDVGQNLSVHLNSNKRLVMEKIQVELNTDVSESKSKPCKCIFTLLFHFFLEIYIILKIVSLIYLVLYGL